MRRLPPEKTVSDVAAKALSPATADPSTRSAQRPVQLAGPALHPDAAPRRHTTMLRREAVNPKHTRELGAYRKRAVGLLVNDGSQPITQP